MALLVAGAGAAAAPEEVRTVPAAVERLGKLSPGETKGSEHRRAAIAPAPVVLFSGLEPALALAAHAVEEDRPRRERTTLEPLEASRLDRVLHRGPFPLELPVAPVAGAGDEGDELERLLVADLDGDGVDELILARTFDGVRVLSPERERLHVPVGVRPGQGHYGVRAHQVVRLGARTAVYLLLGWSPGTGPDAVKAGVEPFRLLRVDERGVEQVRLEGAADDPFAFAVLTDAAGARVDQFVLFGEDRKEGLVVTLHGPDGAQRAGPFRPKVPSAERFELATSPGSARVIAAFPMESETYLWFFELAGGRAKGKVLSLTTKLHLVRAVADAPVPLAVLADESSLYAFDAEGRHWGRKGGAWRRLPAPAPALSIDPGPGHEPVGIFPAGDGRSLLAVASRKKQVWKRRHPEILAAAERFLPAVEVADLKALVKPSAKEEWENARFDDEVMERLAWPIRHPESLRPERYRDVEGLRRWVAESDLRAETRFTLVRDEEQVLRFTAPGFVGRHEVSGFGDQALSWRADGERVTVVLSLAAPDGSGKEGERGFYVVRAGTESARGPGGVAP